MRPDIMKDATRRGKERQWMIGLDTGASSEDSHEGGGGGLDTSSRKSNSLISFYLIPFVWDVSFPSRFVKPISLMSLCWI